MTWDQWLVILTTGSTIYLGYLQYKNSRHSTDQQADITLRGQDLSELKGLRDRVTNLENDYRDLWYYTRGLIDLYYKYRKDDSPLPNPLPDPPRY